MTVRVWTKICGITRLEDAEAAIDAGADALGVNFCAASPRYCDRSRAADIVMQVRGRIPVYGLFVDAPREEVEETMAETGFDGVQLHGEEPDDAFAGWAVPVLRAVRVSSRDAVERVLGGAHDYRILLDTPRGGGSGTEFDETLLRGLDLGAVVVAGGLTPTSVAERVRRLRPFGVDVSSGVESAPGLKDATRVREFVRNAKSAG